LIVGLLLLELLELTVRVTVLLVTEPAELVTTT
jgi:hypothetical protein